MAVEDLEYVERVTGQSLEDEKPLSDIRRRSTQLKKGEPPKRETRSPPGTYIGPSRSVPKGSDYDWFDFFLKAGVNPHQCQRYSDNFNKDSMDESILPDITASVLRTLGLKEGDILRVMKYLDTKFGRTGASARAKGISETDTDGKDEESTSTGGLFSGPGGTLRNNTRKGRPAPAVQTNNSVNAETFKQPDRQSKPEVTSQKPESVLPTPPKDVGSFDDDAWDVKPSKQAPAQAPAPASPAPTPSTSVPPQPVTGAMAELSLLTPPLQPTPSQPAQTQQQQQQQKPPSQAQAPVASPPNIQPQPTGANPAFFTQLNTQPTGAPQSTSMPGYNVQQPIAPLQQNSAPRQRPQAPALPQQGSFLPPPPRPLSAPQNAPQNNAFGPPALMPQLTGYQPNQVLKLPMAPPGESLDESSAMRRQQLLYQSQPQYAQQTGFQPQNQNFGQTSNGINLQPTGFQSTNQFTGMQYTNGSLNPQPTGLQQQIMPQPTGFKPPFEGSLQPQPTGINSVLQPALQPQQTGVNSFGGRPGFGQPPMPAPPLPPIPQQPTAQPLVAQKTGPAPPVSFGANKLVPQPTGRRANLSQASKLDLDLMNATADMHSSPREPIWLLVEYTGYYSLRVSGNVDALGGKC